MLELLPEAEQIIDDAGSVEITKHLPAGKLWAERYMDELPVFISPDEVILVALSIEDIGEARASVDIARTILVRLPVIASILEGGKDAIIEAMKEAKTEYDWLGD